jgi:hypothetical protein
MTSYDFALKADNLAKLEVQKGKKAVDLVKDCLRSLTSDNQMEEFLDSYLLALMSYGEEEKEAKNYRSRVKAILREWKDEEKRSAILEHDTRSIQLLSKFARGLGKDHQETTPETGETGGDTGVITKTERLLSLGDISAELDRLAQHLAQYKPELAERLLVLSNEVVEETVETCTM